MVGTSEKMGASFWLILTMLTADPMVMLFKAWGILTILGWFIPEDLPNIWAIFAICYAVKVLMFRHDGTETQLRSREDLWRQASAGWLSHIVVVFLALVSTWFIHLLLTIKVTVG
jgi:hypothetical protein